MTIPTPTIRPRRLRKSPGLRAMVRETQLSAADFIYPLFVTHGRQVRQEIPSMPGVFQLSVDQLAQEAEEAAAIRAATAATLNTCFMIKTPQNN